MEELEHEQGETLADVQVDEKTRKRLFRYQTRFRRALEAVQPRHTEWAEIDKFDRGEQWEDVPVPPWVPKPVANYVRYMRTLKRANLTSNIPYAVFSPEYYEDTEIVAKLQKAYMHVWDREDVPDTVRRVVDRSLHRGTGIAYVYEDSIYVGGKYYGSADPEDEDYSPMAYKNQLYQGRICVKEFPAPRFFPDPDAFRIEDCKFIETTELMALSTIRNTPMFREYVEEKGYSMDLLKGSLIDRDQGANGDIFDRDVNPTQELNHKLDDDDMVTLHAHWERYLNDDGTWQLDVTYYIKEVPFELLRIEDVKPNIYPFVILYDEEEDEDFFGSSNSKEILSLQKVINKTSQTASIIATLNQNPQKVVLRESGINAQEMARTGTLPGKVWVSNIPNSVETINPPDIPRGLFETEDRMKNDIREMSGINEAYTGDSVGSLTTSTGVQELIERATIRDRDKMRQIDKFVEKLSHLIVMFILHKWDSERPITNRQPDGSIEQDMWQPLDDITIKNLDWRVKSDVYASSPITQASKRQQADKLLTLQGQHQFQPAIITPEEYIQIFDFDDKEKILERMKRDREVMREQQLNQAQQAPIQFPPGEVSIAMNSKDPNFIYGLMEQFKQQGIDMAINRVQQEIALDKGHGLLPQQPQGQGPAPIETQAPNGAPSPVAMQNMTNGG